MLPEILGCYQSTKREKMGRAGTSRDFTQSIEWLAMRLPPESILIFPLGKDRLPLPLQKTISAEEFLNHFLPEPLLYREQLAPAAQVLAELLRKTDPETLDQTALSGAERALYTVILSALGSAGHTDPPSAVGTVLQAAVVLPDAADDVQKASINAFGIHLRKRRDFETAILFYRKALEMAQPTRGCSSTWPGRCSKRATRPPAGPAWNRRSPWRRISWRRKNSCATSTASLPNRRRMMSFPTSPCDIGRRNRPGRNRKNPAAGTYKSLQVALPCERTGRPARFPLPQRRRPQHFTV